MVVSTRNTQNSSANGRGIHQLGSEPYDLCLEAYRSPISSSHGVRRGSPEENRRPAEEPHLRSLDASGQYGWGSPQYGWGSPSYGYGYGWGTHLRSYTPAMEPPPPPLPPAPDYYIYLQMLMASFPTQYQQYPTSPQPYTSSSSLTWVQQPTSYTASTSSWYHQSSQISPTTSLQQPQWQYQTGLLCPLCEQEVFDKMPEMSQFVPVSVSDQFSKVISADIPIVDSCKDLVQVIVENVQTEEHESKAYTLQRDMGSQQEIADMGEVQDLEDIDVDMKASLKEEEYEVVDGDKDDESSVSDRDNKTMKNSGLKRHSTKRKFDSISDYSDSHSSVYNSNTNFDSEDSCDYSQEKHGRREARANDEIIISKSASQERSVVEEVFSVKTESKSDDGKNKIANDNVSIVGKSKHLGSSEKADRDDVFLMRRNSKEVQNSNSRSSGAQEERLDERDARAYVNYSRSTEDHRREDHSSVNEREKQKEYFNETALWELSNKYGRNHDLIHLLSALRGLDEVGNYMEDMKTIRYQVWGRLSVYSDDMLFESSLWVYALELMQAITGQNLSSLGEELFSKVEPLEEWESSYFTKNSSMSLSQQAEGYASTITNTLIVLKVSQLVTKIFPNVKITAEDLITLDSVVSCFLYLSEVSTSPLHLHLLLATWEEWEVTNFMFPVMVWDPGIISVLVTVTALGVFFLTSRAVVSSLDTLESLFTHYIH